MVCTIGEGDVLSHAHEIIKILKSYGVDAAADYSLKIGDLSACLTASKSLRKNGRVESALFFLKKIEEIGENNAMYWNELGIIFGRLKKYDDAVEAFAKAAMIENRREIWVNLGRSLTIIGKTSLAEKCYKIADKREIPDHSIFEDIKKRNGTKPSGIDFISMREDILEKILEMKEEGYGCAIFTSEYVSLFRASVAFLLFLMRDLDMDGVLISTTKPSSIYKRILEKRCREIKIFCVNSLPFIKSSCDEFMWNVERYSLEDIEYAVEIGVQKIAEKFGGEEHFVFFDDISVLNFYFSKTSIIEFMNKFAADMNKAHIFSFYAIPLQKKVEYSRKIMFRCKREIKI